MAETEYEVSAESQPDGRPGIPWERRAELGLFAGLVRTLGLVIGSPSVAFSQMRRTGGWADPLGFALLVGTFSMWVGQLWDMVIRSVFAAGTGIGVERAAAENTAAIWLALAAPLIVIVITAVGAAIAHALLILFGGAPHPYETTFRVICYMWAVNVFQLVPICGALAAAVWGIVVQIIGLRYAQDVPVERAALAVLIPVVVACVCFMMLAFLAFGLVGLAGLEVLG